MAATAAEDAVACTEMTLAPSWMLVAIILTVKQAKRSDRHGKSGMIEYVHNVCAFRSSYVGARPISQLVLGQ